MADVWLAHRSEHGFRDGVTQHIGIRVSFQPMRMRDRHAAENQRPAFFKRMHVVTNANSSHARIVAADRNGFKSGFAELPANMTSAHFVAPQIATKRARASSRSRISSDECAASCRRVAS